MSDLVVTIDGPAGSGKSTIAKLLAEELGAVFLDTGAMYRAVTLAAMRKGKDLSDSAELMDLLQETEFGFAIEDGEMSITIDGADVSEEIRDPEVTIKVRHVASDASMRNELVAMQRSLAKNQEMVVTEGRDQGTVVFGDADFKFFLTADLTERARRRRKQLLESGQDVDIEQLQEQIKSRDASDQLRTVGPLVAAKDAIVIDTTGMSVKEVVENLIEHIGARNDGK